MNSFLHFLNLHPSIHHCITPTPPITSYVHSDLPIPDNATLNNQQENDNSKSYSIIPWSDSAIEADCKLEKVQTWLETLERPEGLSNSEYKTFMGYCTEFVIIRTLVKESPGPSHNGCALQSTIVPYHISPQWHQTSQNLCYKCPTLWVLLVAWYGKRCKMVHSDLSPLPDSKSTAVSYSLCHCDSSPLILQSLHGYNVYAHIRRVQVHHPKTLLLISWLEWAMLQKETRKTLGNWILCDFIYCWGLLCEIVTENGPAFLKALAYLEKHSHQAHLDFRI